MSAPRALSLPRLAFALALAAFSTAVAAQESADSAATPGRPRSLFAVRGASTITIYPDSLPDVPRTMSELLAMGAPGVFVQHASGAAGAGAWISIRDAAAVRGADPLVVIDGVPAVAFAPYVPGPNERRPPSRLDEIPVASVERVEILAGPAAAARYGREARAGVIEITTRSPGRGRPSIRASLSAGGASSADEFPRNQTRVSPYGDVCRPTDTWGSCPSATPSRYTPLLDASPFQSAPVRQGNLSIAGGLPSGGGFALDVSHDRAGGLLDADGRDLTTGGVRLQLPIGDRARIGFLSRASGRGVTTPFDGDGSIVALGLRGAADCSTATPCAYDSTSRGYGAAAPDELARRGTKHRSQHYTNGARLTFAARPWLELRTTASNDAYLDRGGWGYDVANNNGYPPYMLRDERDEHSVRTILGQELSARRTLGSADLVTSVAFRNDFERGHGSGYDFAGYAQAYSWTRREFRIAQRRQVLTVAPRLTGAWGSVGLGATRTQQRFEKFGAKTKATLDGSADVSVLVRSDETSWLRSATLRAAAGQISSYQVSNALPDAFGSGAGFGMVPNPDGLVRPDRSYEEEAGLDLALAPASSRLSFTAFRRRETDRGMYSLFVTYSGYQILQLYGSLRRAVNGAELSLASVPLARANARLETNLTATLLSDRVVSTPTYYPLYGGYAFGPDHLSFDRGRSFGSWQSAGYTYADANGDGKLDFSEVQLADGGYTGRSRPSRLASLDARLTVARRWTIGANAGYIGGHKVLDKVEAVRCQARVCSEWQSADLGAQAFAMVPGSTPYFVSGDALRVRELSLGYALPMVAHATHASDTRLTIAVRNVATFSHAPSLDPMTELPVQGFTFNPVQGPTYATPRTVLFRLSTAY